MFDNVIDNLIF